LLFRSLMAGWLAVFVAVPQSAVRAAEVDQIARLTAALVVVGTTCGDRIVTDADMVKRELTRLHEEGSKQIGSKKFTAKVFAFTKRLEQGPTKGSNAWCEEWRQKLLALGYEFILTTPIVGGTEAPRLPTVSAATDPTPFAKQAAAVVAVTAQCKRHIFIDPVRAEQDFKRLIEQGNKIDKNKFTMAMADALNGLDQDPKKGTPDWCNHWRSVLSTAGFDFVARTNKTSLEIISMIAGLTVLQERCDHKNALDLGPDSVRRHGHVIDDFVPEGRYGPLIRERIAETDRLLKSKIITCARIRESLAQEVPELN
jgi:hypothetical protein